MYRITKVPEKPMVKTGFDYINFLNYQNKRDGVNVNTNTNMYRNVLSSHAFRAISWARLRNGLRREPPTLNSIRPTFSHELCRTEQVMHPFRGWEGKYSLGAYRETITERTLNRENTGTFETFQRFRLATISTKPRE
jgi:hypothetical protein